jgi:hypothetical protein
MPVSSPAYLFMELIPYETVSTALHRGARKIKGHWLELSKVQLYLLIHGLFWFFVLSYQSLWLFSEKTMATCWAYEGPYAERRRINPGTLMYQYHVGDRLITESTTRNGVPITQQTIEIRYLPWWPELSRPNTYESNWLAFVISWLLLFTITSIIFFIPNETMPRNSYFYFNRQKPFIHMIVK